MTTLTPDDRARFIADAHLGRLAAYLRLAGFDTVYEAPWEDAELARRSAEEGRILLTRDRGLLKRSIITRGYFVQSTNSREQFAELVRRFDLRPLMRPFSRCARCNTPLREVSKTAVLDRLLPRTRLLHDEFLECTSCRRVYWRGSHHARIASWFDGF
ncbi:MAG TPA: Mut7-C RNAse domain-containing protein [Vicinamibacterales bacterium]|nr:Mut7-C RNAse domain-containing protein [Vicinamibacterales bacterium]